MSAYFYSLEARKYYKDLMEAQKDMFPAFIHFNNEILEKESALPQSTIQNGKGDSLTNLFQSDTKL